MPPAYLAWMPGGFRLGFRAAVSAMPGLTATVVVAGDTLWRTASRVLRTDVDRPTPPYRVPIDTFAVDRRIHDLHPAAYRDVVTRTLADGRAVLGTTSAAVRRLGVGGRCGAAVWRSPSEPSFRMRSSAGARRSFHARKAHGSEWSTIDTSWLARRPRCPTRRSSSCYGLSPRTGYPCAAAPGEVPYVRVASGSTPPVVLKEVFGEFAAYPDAADPIQLHVDPAWIEAHLPTRTVPVLGRETCNRAFFRALEGAMRQLQREGLAHLVTSNAGCYNPELLASLPTASPAFHAYGAAIDINAPENPFGATPTQDPRLVAVMEHWGFNWGGTFLVPDGMHFEYLRPPPKA